jgi:hypothetical protein
MQPKAFKRISVEFTQEVNGERKPATMDFVRESNSRLAHTPGAFENHVVEVLEKCGAVKPEVTHIDMRLGEPPFIEI